MLIRLSNKQRFDVTFVQATRSIKDKSSDVLPLLVARFIVSLDKIIILRY